MNQDNYLNLPRLRQFYDKLKTVFITKKELVDMRGSLETIQSTEPTNQSSGDFWLQSY